MKGKKDDSPFLGMLEAVDLGRGGEIPRFHASAPHLVCAVRYVPSALATTLSRITFPSLWKSFESIASTR